MNPLVDKSFLKELDNYNNKEVYIRVTALTFEEVPIEMIEGRATGGSINIDGASAIRRTCSLSMIAQDVNINDFYWGLNNKIKIEIGLKNVINSTYPDIIWFPQGIFIITSFNTKLSSNGYSISISGQDKMCLLNGSVSGSLPASVDFGVKEDYDIKNNTITYTKIPIKTIIREMLHTYALEPYHNIIINDLDDRGLELLEYRGDIPLYLMYDIGDNVYTNISFDGDQQYYKDEKKTETISLKNIVNYNKSLDGLLDIESSQGDIVYSDKKAYTVSKAEYGYTVGYRLTDLTYPGDLISNIGESVTSILDKIKNMLGNFEYGYDVYGRFIFQKKKTYLSTSWSPILGTEKDRYVENAAYAEKNSYYFNGSNLISSFSNNPDLKNIKNDYSIWGVRTTISGADIPVHFRYAIHKKPTTYVSYDGIIYEGVDTKKIPKNKYDWRELIYQMAVDYYKYGQKDDFLQVIGNHNKDDYPTGKTGYEQFYIDMQGFWRQIYNLDDKGKFTYDNGYDINATTPINNGQETIVEKAWHFPTVKHTFDYKKNFDAILDAIPEEVIYAAKVNAECYLTSDFTGKKSSAAGRWPITMKTDKWACWTNDEDETWYCKVEDIIDYHSIESDSIKRKLAENAVQIVLNNPGDDGWHYTVSTAPETLNFWLDFTGLDGSELDKYSVQALGCRSKVVNDTAIKSIYYRNVPNLIFVSGDYDRSEKTGYIFANITENIWDYFTISSQGKSAKDELDELLYNHSYCTESINISAIPIYYLEPNTSISVYDELSKINGEYIVSKITLPLTHNGQMTVQATKAPQRFN